MTTEELNIRMCVVIRSSTETELELHEDLNFITQMGLSSMEIMLMISDLEDAIGMELPISELREVTTVGDLCQVVRRVICEN